MLFISWTETDIHVINYFVLLTKHKGRTGKITTRALDGTAEYQNVRAYKKEG